jgi:hypothetical protein
MPGRPKAPKTAKRPVGKKKAASAKKKSAVVVKRRLRAAPRVAARPAKTAKAAKAATKAAAANRPTAKKSVAAKPKKRAKGKSAPPPRPSERALATSAQLPSERALSDDEREALAKVAGTARRFVDAVGGPDAVVQRIAAFIDEVRAQTAAEPQSQDVRLGLGALWGEQLRAQVGWVWVHLTYPDGFASYALVPDDRAFACFPLNRVQELMSAAVRANTTVAIFNSIVAGTLPATRRKSAYLVIG